MRNAEGGTRNRSSALRVGRLPSRIDLPNQFRVPTSAFRVCLLLAACTPATTRPDFKPDPQAPEVILNARPPRVTPEIAASVAAESLRVERVNVRDGYVETAWYDTRTGRSFAGTRDVPNPAATVKIRFWADPYVPGQTRLTVETVYRPRYDPSRAERDLEMVVPQDHPGRAIADRVLNKLEKRFGSPEEP
jgi:hypothetical protein